jgi:hypothetical protein
MSIKYSDCVFVALDIQHATRMCHNVICGLSGYTLFSTLSHKPHDSRKNRTDSKMFVLISSTTCDWNISCTQVFMWSCISLIGFQKILKNKLSQKPVQWEPSCAMRTDNGRTDITKLIVHFWNFVQTCLKRAEDKEDNGDKYANDRGPDCDGVPYLIEIRTSSFAT